MDHRPWPASEDPVELSRVPVGTNDTQIRRAQQMLNVLIDQFNAAVQQIQTILDDYTTDTELAAWTGSTYITTLGTIVTGTWQGTAIGDTYIASAETWDGKQDALTFNTYSVLMNEEGVVGLQGDLAEPGALALYGTDSEGARGWYAMNTIATVGTITTGTWQGTAIADSYIASAATWNAKQSALTFSQSLSNSEGTVTLSGDSASPGNSKLYGTNASGTKGWYDQAAAGSYTFQQSLSESDGTVNLVGDETSPGNGKLYGTDSAGNKQWLDVAGTTNEITVTFGGDGVTISLPDDVTIGDDLTVIGTLYTGSGGIVMDY